MTRDAEMPARDYVRLVLANIGSETDAWGLSRVPAYAALAVAQYSAPEHRAALKAEWEQGLRALALAADPGSDHQLTFVRQYAAAARSDAALAEVAGLLDGSVSFEGLEVDQDLRWSLVIALAAAGRFTDVEIDAELARDTTISGKESAAAARVAQPTPEAKAAGWTAIMDPKTPNATSREIVLSIFRSGQDEVVEPYVDTYFEAASTWWRSSDSTRLRSSWSTASPSRWGPAPWWRRPTRGSPRPTPRCGPALRARGSC